MQTYKPCGLCNKWLFGHQFHTFVCHIHFGPKGPCCLLCDPGICCASHLMVLSDEPLTTSLSLYCRHAMPRLWPFKVRTNSQVLVFHTWTKGKPKEIDYSGSNTHKFVWKSHIYLMRVNGVLNIGLGLGRPQIKFHLAIKLTGWWWPCHSFSTYLTYRLWG